jgi:glycerol-3-phosphate dehydrogenase
MERDLAAFGARTFDLLVIGGGIFGASAARAAAQRGLSVALVDRGDFCSATSSNSYKLVHGGLRYLQHLDLRRLRQSSAARRTLLTLAPHLVTPLPIVVPTYGRGLRSKTAMRIAMGAYDLLVPDRNRGIRDMTRRIPPGCCLSRDQVLQRYPGLEQDGLTGAAVFCDGQLYNPTRLVLGFVQAAVQAGATVANYVEAQSFVRDGQRITGVVARDVRNDDTFQIKARMVLNAAGPYAEGLLEGLGRPLEPATPWSRDAYFVVDRPLIEGADGLALPAATRTDALLRRGKRHLFLVPWRGATLVGVWHKVYQGHPDAYHITEEELRGFLEEINAAYPLLKLTPEDVSLRIAGLIPFGQNAPDGEDLKFGDRTRLVDHARERDVEGLITLIGVRYTTGPVDGAAAVDLAIRKLGQPSTRTGGFDEPLPGGDIDDFEALVTQAIRERPATIEESAVRPLLHNHGTQYRRVFDLVDADPDLGHGIGESTVIGAQVVHAARSEMVCTLADVVLRRTDLGTRAYPGHEAIAACGRLVAAELGWNDARLQTEIDQVTDEYPSRPRRADGAENACQSPVARIRP